MELTEVIEHEKAETKALLSTPTALTVEIESNANAVKNLKNAVNKTKSANVNVLMKCHKHQALDLLRNKKFISTCDNLCKNYFFQFFIQDRNIRLDENEKKEIMIIFGNKSKPILFSFQSDLEDNRNFYWISEEVNPASNETEEYFNEFELINNGETKVDDTLDFIRDCILRILIEQPQYKSKKNKNEAIVKERNRRRTRKFLTLLLFLK
jgi:hypothetical protein